MDCRIIAVEQGSDTWLDLRRCRITASRMADVMAKKDTLRYKQYLSEKVKELLGHKGVEETPAWAEHGKRNEKYALAGYEYKFETEIEHNIFLVSKQYDWLACSPDFLHLPDYLDGGEIKCRELYKNYRKFMQMGIAHKGTVKAAPACDRHQVQANMMVTGFKRWWFINFYLGTGPDKKQIQKISRVAIPRDDDLIAAMEIRCLEFMTEAYQGAGLA